MVSVASYSIHVRMARRLEVFLFLFRRKAKNGKWFDGGTEQISENRRAFSVCLAYVFYIQALHWSTNAAFVLYRFLNLFFFFTFGFLVLLGYVWIS